MSGADEALGFGWFNILQNNWAVTIVYKLISYFLNMWSYMLLKWVTHHYYFVENYKYNIDKYFL